MGLRLPRGPDPRSFNSAHAAIAEKGRTMLGLGLWTCGDMTWKGLIWTPNKKNVVLQTLLFLLNDYSPWPWQSEYDKLAERSERSIWWVNKIKVNHLAPTPNIIFNACPLLWDQEIEILTSLDDKGASDSIGYWKMHKQRELTSDNQNINGKRRDLERLEFVYFYTDLYFKA